MKIILWISFALLLIVEGLGPMLWPQLWRRIIITMAQLPDRLLRRFGGGLVVAGVVIYYMLILHDGR